MIISMNEIRFFYEKFVRHQDTKTAFQLIVAIDKFMNEKDKNDSK